MCVFTADRPASLLVDFKGGSRPQSSPSSVDTVASTGGVVGEDGGGVDDGRGEWLADREETTLNHGIEPICDPDAWCP